MRNHINTEWHSRCCASRALFSQLPQQHSGIEHCQAGPPGKVLSSIATQCPVSILLQTSTYLRVSCFVSKLMTISARTMLYFTRRFYSHRIVFLILCILFSIKAVYSQVKYMRFIAAHRAKQQSICLTQEKSRYTWLCPFAFRSHFSTRLPPKCFATLQFITTCSGRVLSGTEEASHSNERVSGKVVFLGS